MTATLPTGGPSITGGPPPVRLDARPGVVYAYNVRDILQPDRALAAVVADDYVGQSRNQPQRDLQHRGLAPERDGVVREKPWADRIDGVHILESGVWTNAELNVREQWWINHLKPRLNKAGNESNANRIPIYEQHRLRKARDSAWVIPDWSRRAPSTAVLPCPEPSSPVPGRPQDGLWATRTGRRLSAWLSYAVKVFAMWVALTVSGAAALTAWHVAPWRDAAGLAAIGAGVGLCLLLKPKNTRPRRGGRASSRRRTR